MLLRVNRMAFARSIGSIASATSFITCCSLPPPTYWLNGCSDGLRKMIGMDGFSLSA